MNVIQKSISDCLLRIPREVLQHALYIGRGPKQVDVSTIGSKIMSMIIRPRVLVDLNLISSNIKFVDIKYCTISEKDKFGMVITVPSNRIGGGSIISPASISTDGSEGLVHTNLELIAENTIYLHDVQSLSGESKLKCTVTYDAQLSNIPPGAYSELSLFMTAAVKAFCYNELRVRLSKGEIYQGAELTEIRSTIDEYSEAEAEYEERKTKVIAKLLFMSNESAMSEFVKHHFPR